MAAARVGFPSAGAPSGMRSKRSCVALAMTCLVLLDWKYDHWLVAWLDRRIAFVLAWLVSMLLNAMTTV